MQRRMLRLRRTVMGGGDEGKEDVDKAEELLGMGGGRRLVVRRVRRARRMLTCLGEGC